MHCSGYFGVKRDEKLITIGEIKRMKEVIMQKMGTIKLIHLQETQN
jgi:hypothetical protein